MLMETSRSHMGRSGVESAGTYRQQKPLRINELALYGNHWNVVNTDC
jgi:hypothetical protein